MLDVSQGEENFGQVIIWKKHGKKNQKFRIIQNVNGRYSIVSSSTMQVLAPRGNSHENGHTMHTAFNDGHHGQQWEFTAAEK